jgi:gas vesicle protein
MNTGKILLGILAGAGTGALLGILLAPQKGIDTRKKIAKMGKDYSDSVKYKFDESLEKISKNLKKIKKDISAFSSHNRNKVDKLNNASSTVTD